MNEEFMQMCDDLESEIVRSYTETISIPQAENLAGKFLTAQLQVSRELQIAELDSRMKKSGAKAVAASVFLNTAKSGDKKPSDNLIAATVDSDKIVCEQRDSYDRADVYVNTLERYYDIFREAHIFFRGQARQSF